LDENVAGQNSLGLFKTQDKIMREKEKVTVKKKLSKKNDSRCEVGLRSLSGMAGKLICTYSLK